MAKTRLEHALDEACKTRDARIAIEKILATVPVDHIPLMLATLLVDACTPRPLLLLPPPNEGEER